MTQVNNATMPHTKRLLRRALGARWRRYLGAYWMIAPALALYAVFVVYPIGQGLWVSLHQWDGFSEMRWSGLENYRLALDDRVFWLALRHTLLFAAVVALAKTGLGLLFAILLDLPIRGRTLFRVSAFLPVTMAFVAAGVLWSWIYNPTFGLLNTLLRAAGLGFLIHGWLSDPRLALWSIMVVDIWKWTGFHVVLLLAGLQSIPRELYDAAIVDGASSRQRLAGITLPLLRPMIAVSITLALAGGLASSYDVVYVMTAGGPSHATEIAATWIMSTAFRFGSFGKASAMSMILFAIAATLGIAQLAMLSRRQHD